VSPPSRAKGLGKHSKRNATWKWQTLPSYSTRPILEDGAGKVSALTSWYRCQLASICEFESGRNMYNASHPVKNFACFEKRAER
jgi:hypothetical protein